MSARVLASLTLALALNASAFAAVRPMPADPTVRESRSWICIVGAKENPAYVGTFRSQKAAAGWCARVVATSARPCHPERLWLPAKEAK